METLKKIILENPVLVAVVYFAFTVVVAFAIH